jgi:type II secretory pathway component PulF
MLAWASFGWLLWRYVPPHAALFAGLGTPLPRSATLVILASNWFIRLLPFLILLVLLVGRALVVPLFVDAIQRHERSAVTALSVLLSLATVTGLAASAFVIHAMHAGCSQAIGEARYQQEIRDLNAARDYPCSVNWPP